MLWNDSKVNKSLNIRGLWSKRESKGWRSGESARLQTMWPRFKSRCQRHMWAEFVFGSLLCFEKFFSAYSSFPLSSTTSISKFQFDQESGRQRTTFWMCFLQIVIIIIIIIIIITIIIIIKNHTSDMNQVP